MHKLLFDQNLPHRIIKQIENFFPVSSHVRILNLDKVDDLDIWNYAKINGYHIVTKDSVFNDLNTLYGYPPKIIRLNAGNISTNKVIQILPRNLDTIQKFIENDKIGFLELD